MIKKKESIFLNFIYSFFFVLRSKIFLHLSKSILSTFETLLKIKPPLRIYLLLIMDFVILLFSLLITSILLSVDNLYYFKLNNYFYLFYLIIIGLPFYYFTSQYKDLTRYISSKSIYNIILRNLIIIFILHIFFSPPLSFSFVICTFISFISYTIRIILKDLIFRINRNDKFISSVLIYGAGEAGALLLSNLKVENNYDVKGFIDDDLSLKGRSILGKKIYSPKELEIIKNKFNIEKILLAIPSIDKENFKRIINNISSHNIEVYQIPALTEIVTGKSKINKLMPINVEDILGRGIVKPYYDLLKSDMENAVILVSGAGGSIGSELCRELVSFKVQKILLFDNSEPNLYNIFHELTTKHKLKDKEIIPILGSVSNSKLVDNVIKKNKVSIIFHAAAYKHVPLVEINPLQGLENNIFSTKVLCEKALKYSVKKFVLISSDKAVRPTNLMGASKRISELIVQGFHEQSLKNNKTIFLMVRFGNVLNSSGSVIPLFRDQIKNGGPITLTHEKITRFFMTINEASQLVLQAVSLAKGGDVFLLDMGKPVSIKEVAKQMISLSGLTLKDSSNPDGDIEILVTGLRTGEKLFEELLIDSDSLRTKHPLIFKANESFIKFSELMPIIEKLEKSLLNQELNESLSLVSELVPEWKSELYS